MVMTVTGGNTGHIMGVERPIQKQARTRENEKKCSSVAGREQQKTTTFLQKCNETKGLNCTKNI